MALDMTTALTIRAKVDGLGQISGLTKGLGGVTDKSNAAAGAMGRLRSAAAGAMGAMRTLLPVLGVGAMVKVAKDNLDAADAMSKMSQRTGVAASTLDKFRKVAELSDTSIEGLGKGFKTLASNMYDAQARGTGPAADAFNKLGIAVADSSGKLRSSDQVMLDIADRFKAMEDGPKKAALAADLFGAKIGDELIPLLNSGGDAVRDMGTSMTQEFADKAAAFNDRLETMQEKLGDIGLRLTEALLPALEALASGLEAFTALPEPIQNLALAFGAFATAALILGPIITPIIAGFKLLAGIKLGATIAGWLPVFVKIGPAIATVGKILIGVFSGPVGWVALAVAAGVAIYAFRDQIGKAFQAIGGILKAGAAGFESMFIKPVVAGFTVVVKFVDTNFVKPVQSSITGLVEMIGKTFNNVTQAITRPFEAAFQTVRGIVNNILNGIGNAIRSVVQAINNVIAGANRGLSALFMPQIPYLPKPNIPQFAEGGVVKGPTLAMVGEGGEPEYIIPQSKMAAASANYLGGARGGAVIPAFADGGFVGGNAQISITTGPVLQQGGEQYVTLYDLERAMQMTADGVYKSLRTSAGRYAVGTR
jgi:hypothetical protein